MKSLHEMEELKRVQGSRFDEFSIGTLIENQDSTLELTGKIQELQNEINCTNDSRDFKDAESVRSGLSHVPSQPALLSPFRDPGGMLSRSVGMLRHLGLTDIHGPGEGGGERLTRKQTTSRPDNVWQDMWMHVSDAANSKAKQKWAIEKPKLDNARQLCGILFIEPDDEKF